MRKIMQNTLSPIIWSALPVSLIHVLEALEVKHDIGLSYCIKVALVEDGVFI